MPSPPADPASSDWLRQRPAVQGTELGPLQLAWLGDAVWELHQRLRRCREPGRSDSLHRAVVEEVRAGAQAAALLRLDPLLSELERDWVRRGRNRAGRGPRRADPATYGQATGFETMVGWLFLRNPGRLAQLLDHLEQPGPDPLPENVHAPTI
ncbi:ribonuclease III [Synechococcus sp. CS-1325]|uniref:ribonuclease III domain-containing protein n=1 Tax=unclassified Synechococcus TaxID=2626047 RepID=UPI000DB3877B|nr:MULTISPECIES: ribonuclease III domain-containing protein [unclassified Synechococcus]MCT0198277.1 ribonuclease III [Synechococcus sp. CS-1325]MCT0230861.1 ribonuclease III [Synechococcus sp. CS-1324]PZV00706.1 MAG: ribonuclease III [Cyanobium sp.]PZV01140.1 MAG: ribonuclease III [Cyanobium sp.]